MQIIMIVYVVVLFVALTPSVLLRLPAGGSKLTVAVVHGLVFATVLYFTQGLVSDALYAEGFQSPLPMRRCMHDGNCARTENCVTKPANVNINLGKGAKGACNWNWEFNRDIKDLKWDRLTGKYRL